PLSPFRWNEGGPHAHRCSRNGWRRSNRLWLGRRAGPGCCDVTEPVGATRNRDGASRPAPGIGGLGRRTLRSRVRQAPPTVVHGRRESRVLLGSFGRSERAYTLVDWKCPNRLDLVERWGAVRGALPGG